MPDIFDQIAPTQGRDIFDEISVPTQTKKPMGFFAPDAFKGMFKGEFFVPEKIALAAEQRKSAAQPFEMQGVTEAPFVDPLLTGTVSGAMVARQAAKAGAPFIKAGVRGIANAVAAGVSDIPIGTVTDEFAENHPYLAIPFNMALGVLHGVTVENIIDKHLARKLGKASPHVSAIIKTYIEEGDISNPITRDIVDEINAHPKIQAAAKQYRQGPRVGDIETKQKADIFDQISPLEKPPIEVPTVEAIPPQGLVNAITREKAGDMMVAGDKDVAHHIAEGVIEKGRPQVEDAIRNEELGRIVKTPKGPQREALKQRLASLEPAINEALAHPETVSGRIEQPVRKKAKTQSDTEISITDFVRKYGGLSTEKEALKGEIRDRLTIKEGYNLVNNKTGRSLDDMTEASIAGGFLPEGSTIREFLDAIDNDVTAKKAKTQTGRAWSSFKQDFEIPERPLPNVGKDQEMFAGVNKVPTAGLKTETTQADDMLAGFRKAEEDKQRGMFTAGASADTGGYSKRGPTAIEMPEIVELSKGINDGKYPIIKQRLGAKFGVFRHKGDQGDITLRADIYAGDMKAAVSVKPNEAEGAFEGFKKSTIEKLGLPEDQIVFRKEYNKKSGLVDLKAYERNPQLAPKVLAHEIGHLVDWLPDKDLRRGNVLGRIATLKRYMGSLLDSLPTDSSKVLSEKDRSEIRKGVISRVMGSDWHWSKGKPSPAQAQMIKDGYKESIDKYIARQGLITKDEAITELKAITREWKPFDDKVDANYTKYRYSSKELYADAISVLVNEPQLLKEKAPKFYKSMLAYMERKPEVKAIYEGIQDRVGNRAEVVDTRINNLYDMMDKGDAARQRLNQRNLVEIEGIKDTASRWLIDKYHASLKVIRAAEKIGGDLGEKASKARYDLEETNYIASEAENYLHKIQKGIVEGGESRGVTAEDMGIYMFANRVAKERTDIANPLGHTKESATEILEALPKKWGDEKYSAVKDSVNQYRVLREELILPRVEEAKMFDYETMKILKENADYAKFSVHKFLEDKFGGGVTSKIYQQVGTHQEIENPFIATILQDISLLRAAKINESKASLFGLLREVPGGLKPAEMKYSLDVKGRIPVDPKDPKVGLLTVMVEGKPEHYYVSKVIADTFTHSPFEATKIGHVWAAMNQPLRDILVSKNPVWMARNVWRDIKTTVKNIPEVRLRDAIPLLSDYKTAFGEVWRDVIRGERSSDIEKMMKGRMLLSNRAYSAREQTFDNELDKLATEFNLKEATESRKAYAVLKRVYNGLDKLGRVSELTGKVAGYKYLKGRTLRGDKEIGHIVRTRIGTPDVKRQGELQQITNNIFLFSTVNKEGLRSAVESYKEDPSAYIWKTIAMNIVPKLMLIGAASVGGAKIKELIDNVSNYDKRTKTIIPLWLQKDGKSAVLTIPEDYEGQVFGALAWDMAHGKIGGKDGVIGTIAGVSPYRLNPLIQVGEDLYQYYINGLNPIDEFRGRNVIPKLAYEAGGDEANVAMGKHTWRSLGGSVLYQPSYNELVKDENTTSKLLKTFPLNVLGAFVKITDQGKAEQLENTIDDIRQRKSTESLDRQTIIKQGINAGETLGEVVDDLKRKEVPLTMGIGKQYQDNKMMSTDDPYLNSLGRARSIEEKRAILNAIPEEKRKDTREKLKRLLQQPELPTEAPNSPVVEPEAKVEPETLTIPDHLMIEAVAVTDNGKLVKYKANAKEVLKDVEERLTLYGKIMEALG